MCGIAGFVDFGGHAVAEAQARVRRMADTLVHRGPDEEGFYVDDLVALGHRRLSIIDLSSGQQPMSTHEGQVQIVFNGEIYNFVEVRAQLEARGHRFKTQCDTEVILIGYLEWGEHCLEKLNGMFAFAIWDARFKRLVLARDRVGKKPLYYCRKGSLIGFASELKALRAGGLCHDAVDAEALDCYFSLGYIPAPRTIYKGVRKLRAARCLTISGTGESERQYWQLSFAEPVARSVEEATDEFAPLLDDAVKCRLMSEVPLGAFLSGGIDSSLVVSSMAHLLQRPVATNSIGFDEEQFNELPVAGAIAAHLRTEHHEYVVKPKAVDVIERIAWHFDEPLADSSAVPTWYVCEMAKRSVTVALSGDGGDETFGGYTFRYLPHMLESKIRAAIPVSLRSAAFGTLGSIWPASAKLPKPLRLKTIFENLSRGDAEAFYCDLASLRNDTRDDLYSNEFMAELRGFTPMETVQPYYSQNDAGDALGRSQHADILSYMTDDVLVKVDRMSMAHSLEVRCPLLDHRIIEFAAKLPAGLKVGARSGKRLLRALAARRLPREILNLPKRGFSIPAARWLRNELRPLCESIVTDRNRFFSGMLNEGKVREMWREHLSEARDHSVFLWGLMMLGLWEAKNLAPVPSR
jgi:asparagine synthase (glutamine-hydrolysing)